MIATKRLFALNCFLLPKVNPRYFCQLNLNKELIKYFENTFDLPTYKVESIMLQFPTVRNISETQIDSTLQTLTKFGIEKESIIKNPKILNCPSYTLKMRCLVLKECGFPNVDLNTVSRYITLITKRTLAELKHSSILPKDIEIWDLLLECFDSYPDIQSKFKRDANFNKISIGQMRLEIIQQFLEFKYNLSKGQFDQMIKTYPALKHRSLTTICETLKLVENELGFSKEKILAHGFILETNPENIYKLITEVKHLGGIDIKELFLKFPQLLRTNYKNILKMKEVFKLEGITEEAQQKCPEIFTLSSETVHKRIQMYKGLNAFKGFFDNPRILKLVYYKKAISKRIIHLQIVNKKCSSLHKLVSKSHDFDRYIQSFGDKTRGVDIIRSLNKFAPLNCDKVLIKEQLLRHPFWTYVPLQSIIINLEYIQQSFSADDIFQNCHLLLYPLDYIKSNIEYINSIKFDEMNSAMKLNKIINGNFTSEKLNVNPHIKMNKLTGTQILGLTLYLLERDHNFTGNGIWSKQNCDAVVSVT